MLVQQLVLDDVVLFDADETKHCVEQESNGVGEIGGVIGQRLDVALHRLDLGAHVFRPARGLVPLGSQGQGDAAAQPAVQGSARRLD